MSQRRGLKTNAIKPITICVIWKYGVIIVDEENMYRSYSACLMCMSHVLWFGHDSITIDMP